MYISIIMNISLRQIEKLANWAYICLCGSLCLFLAQRCQQKLVLGRVEEERNTRSALCLRLRRNAEPFSFVLSSFARSRNLGLTLPSLLSHSFPQTSLPLSSLSHDLYRGGRTLSEDTKMR